MVAIWCLGIGGAGPTVAAKAPKALTDLAWIAGDWVGDQGGAWIQEMWSQPEGDTMMGMFRLVQDGQLVFTEFMSIEQADGDPVLRIKHFDPGLLGWEEKQESMIFELKELTPGKVVFETEMEGHPEYLTYERNGDTLVVTLEKPAKDSRSQFRFRRADP